MKGIRVFGFFSLAGLSNLPAVHGDFLNGLHIVDGGVGDPKDRNVEQGQEVPVVEVKPESHWRVFTTDLGGGNLLLNSLLLSLIASAVLSVICCLLSVCCGCNPVNVFPKAAPYFAVLPCCWGKFKWHGDEPQYGAYQQQTQVHNANPGQPGQGAYHNPGTPIYMHPGAAGHQGHYAATPAGGMHGPVPAGQQVWVHPGQQAQPKKGWWFW